MKMARQSRSKILTINVERKYKTHDTIGMCIPSSIMREKEKISRKTFEIYIQLFQTKNKKIIKKV
ncbi:hypothetical protein GCM10008931_11060 [Oceanobacillus oncorhynchi subsp. oncorhynchi]